MSQNGQRSHNLLTKLSFNIGIVLSLSSGSDEQQWKMCCKQFTPPVYKTQSGTADWVSLWRISCAMLSSLDLIQQVLGETNKL